MRLLSLMRPAALVACAAFAAFALAQFQQPTPDELKMTSDPKAPGAAAVYLNIEETADDNQNYHSFYARIKVLTDKGKDLANVEIPYGSGFKITDIKGRTIHSDGTVIPLEGKPEDLLAVKSGEMKVGRKVFTLPSVEVGSILEYSWVLRYDDNRVSSPRWQIQQPYFVHKAHYSFTPFKAFLKGSLNATNHYVYDDRTGQALDNLIWWPNLPKDSAGVQRDAQGRFSLDVTDIPPLPDEEWMPPMASVIYKVQFYYIGSYTYQQFWADEAKRWSKEVDHFAEPTSKLREAVSGLVAPGDSELVKAQKLYAAVQALDNTDYSREKSASEMQELRIKVAKRAEDTWTQKSGDSEDIALLYLALLRSAGLTAYAMKVVDRDRAVFDPSYMYRDQFDSTIVILSTGEKEIPLDPGEKMCPFGSLDWRHADADGMREALKSSGFAKTPPQTYVENSTLRTGDINIDAQGAVSGVINVVMVGQAALRWRQMELRNDDAEVKKRFDRELEEIVPEGVEAHVDHFLSMDDPSLNLIAVVKVKGSMGAVTAKRLLLPGFFFESRGGVPFVKEEKRFAPVDMRYAERVSDQITYHLPAGMIVEGGPQDSKVSWPDHAICAVSAKADPGEIVVTRVLARNFDLAKPEEYQDLRGFYQKVAASDQQEMVLRVTPATAGQ